MGMTIKSTPSKIIIDADAIVYPIGFVAASNGHSPSWAVNKAMATVEKITDKVSFDNPIIEVHFTSSGSPKYRDQFRNVVPYKSSRKKTLIKPAHITDMIAQMCVEFDYWMLSSHEGEADDSVAMSAYSCRSDGTPHVVVHTDKDLDQIPGYHVKLNDGNHYYVGDAEALRNKYQQIIMGDAADDIPGLKGYGKVRAGKLLHSGITKEHTMFERTLNEYIKVLSRQGYSEEYVTDYYYETANLVHLRLHEHDSWSPPDE